MKKTVLLLCGLSLGMLRGGAQELKMIESAPLTQVYGEISESDELLPMNDVGMEFGYVLYEAAVTVPEGEALLELENVRDYAAVYVDGKFQGTVTDNRKTLELTAEPGLRTLCLYVENIGRITYGPEILDNSKGLFGSARLGGGEISGWKITPLEVRDADPEDLAFEPLGACGEPLLPARTFRLRGRRRRLPRRLGMGHGRSVDQRPLPRLVLGRGETAVDPDSRGRPHAERKPYRGFRHQERRPRLDNAPLGQTRVQITSKTDEENNRYRPAAGRRPRGAGPERERKARLQGCRTPRRRARQRPAVANDPRREDHAAQPVHTGTQQQRQQRGRPGGRNPRGDRLAHLLRHLARTAQPAPEKSHGAVAARNPRTVRLRRHPRLPHHLSHLAGPGLLMESRTGEAGCRDRRAGSSDVGRRMDLFRR